MPHALGTMDGEVGVPIGGSGVGGMGVRGERQGGWKGLKTDAIQAVAYLYGSPPCQPPR